MADSATAKKVTWATKNSVSNEGNILRQMIAEAKLTQMEALELFNEGQVRPMALRTLKGYLAEPSSKTFREAPPPVVQRMRLVLKTYCTAVSSASSRRAKKAAA